MSKRGQIYFPTLKLADWAGLGVRNKSVPFFKAKKGRLDMVVLNDYL